eukprot:9469651-Pyramimonas_sp.AAC.1
MFFLQNKCPRGSDCAYSHDLTNHPSRRPKSEPTNASTGPPQKQLDTPKGTGSINDIPKLMDELYKLLADSDFTRVQLTAYFITSSAVGVEIETVEPASKRLCTTDEPGPAAGETREEGESDGVQHVTDNKDAHKELVSETLRREFAQRHPQVEFVNQNPDLRIDFDLSRWEFLPPIRAPIHLYGRYRKLVRTIPQSRWLCSVCRPDKSSTKGKAKRPHPAEQPAATSCDACRGTGLQYADSVQDLIGKRFVDAFGAKDCVLHAMGREDIDVRCLGNGRPFVLELKDPQRRTAPDTLDALAAIASASTSGKVEVVGPLRYCDRSEAVRLKGVEAEKSYTRTNRRGTRKLLVLRVRPTSLTAATLCSLDTRTDGGVLQLTIANACLLPHAVPVSVAAPPISSTPQHHYPAHPRPTPPTLSRSPSSIRSASRLPLRPPQLSQFATITRLP